MTERLKPHVLLTQRERSVVRRDDQPVAEGISFLLGLPKAENFPAFVEQIKKSVSEKIKQAQETEKQEAVPNRIDNDLGTPTVGIENQRENVKKTEKEGNSEFQADLLNL